MKPSQCRKGDRVYARGRGAGHQTHGVISLVHVVQMGANTARTVLVTWDGAIAPVVVAPSELRPEVPAPIGDRDALERWLDT